MKSISVDGLTLVSVLLGISALSMLTLGTAQFMSSSIKSQKHVEDVHTLNEAMLSARRVLDQESFCTPNVLNVAINPMLEKQSLGANFAIRLPGPGNVPGDPIVQEGIQYGTYIMTEVILFLSNPLTAPPADGDRHNFFAGLQLKIEDSNFYNYRTLASPNSVAKTIGAPVQTRQLSFQLQAETANGTTDLIGCGPPPAAGDSGGKTEFLVLHSQSTTTPNCPAGWDSLKQGFSYFGTQRDGSVATATQDLDDPGSCLSNFQHPPATHCNSVNCLFGAQQSVWLSNPPGVAGVNYNLAQAPSRISRCRVCEKSSTVMAVHSQSDTTPGCPNGWSVLWNGFSFLGFNSHVTASPSRPFYRPSLSRPGSCLRTQTRLPIIRCTGATCDYSSTYNYWMRGSNNPNVAARCSVCERD